MGKHENRRKHGRIDSSFDIRLEGEMTGGRVSLSGMNISMGGIYCEVPRHVQLMTKLQATLILPMPGDKEGILEAEMIVVWSDPEAEIPGCESYQIGCAFLPMAEESKEILAQYIESCSRQTAGDIVQ